MHVLDVWKVISGTDIAAVDDIGYVERFKERKIVDNFLTRNVQIG